MTEQNLNSNLAGKTALITGATGGIGEAVSFEFASKGANLVLSGTSEAKLQQLQNRLNDKFGAEHPKLEITAIACDLSDAKSTEQLAKDAAKIGADILICNAGITRDNLFLRMSEGDFTEVLDVNLKSAFLLIKNITRSMMKKKWGRIITISSVVGQMGNAGQANYVASKAALIGLTKTIAREVATKGITANSIAPGFIASKMTEELPQNVKEVMLANIPTGVFGLPQDVANGARFLASNDARYITGQVLNINGGMYM